MCATVVPIGRRRISRSPYNSAVTRVILNRIIMVLAFAGVFVAGVLSMGHMLNAQVPCGESHGCDEVALHSSSYWFGVPVAYFGLAAYLALAAISILQIKNEKLANLGLIISGLGTIISFGFTYVSIFTIKATCMWCLTSTAIMTLLFITQAIRASSDKIEAGDGAADGLMAVFTCVAAVGALGFMYVKLTRAQVPLVLNAEYLQGKVIEDFVPANAEYLGDANAPVIVIEWGDLTCPHCKKSYFEMKNMVTQFPGKIKYVFRHFPLISHEKFNSTLAAMYVELAREKGKFWQALDAVYAFQAPEDVNVTYLNHSMRPFGLTEPYIKKRIQNGKDPIYERVDTDRKVGENLAINSTPTFLIGLKGEKPVVAQLNYNEVLTSPKFSNVIAGP